MCSPNHNNSADIIFMMNCDLAQQQSMTNTLGKKDDHGAHKSQNMRVKAEVSS